MNQTKITEERLLPHGSEGRKIWRTEK